MNNKKIGIINWLTIFFILCLSCLWAIWGIIENFHEGWYSTSLLKNISIMLIQYLSITIILTFISLISIKWHKIGGFLWIILWFAFSYFIFFGGNIPLTSKRVFIWLPLTIPLLLIGLSFYFFEIQNKRVAAVLIIIFPLIIIIAIGIPLFIKVNNRYNDHNFGERIIDGNGIKLIWAPKGPGFPNKGTNWFNARKRCMYLNNTGDRLLKIKQNIWRLPTKEEIVKSLTRKNKNAGGRLMKGGNPYYKITPDKESPLWDPNSIIIYYWSSDTNNEILAYLVSYNGKILLRQKSNGADYHGFRCVRKKNN